MISDRVNLNKVAESLSKRSYKLSDVKDKIVRLGFDMCRFKEDEPNKLWEIHSSDDGDYIVATFEDNDEIIAKASTNPWDTVVKNAEINVFYKKDFVTKIAASSLGFEKGDAEMAASYLPKKLASDSTLVSKLVSSLDSKTRGTLLAKYPELS